MNAVLVLCTCAPRGHVHNGDDVKFAHIECELKAYKETQTGGEPLALAVPVAVLVDLDLKHSVCPRFTVVTWKWSNLSVVHRQTRVPARGFT